jgi:GAF domain-containing protein
MEQLPDEDSRLERLNSLLDVTRSLADDAEPDTLSRQVLDAAIRLVPAADTAVLALHDAERDRLVIWHSAGLGSTAYGVAVAAGEGLIGRAFQLQRSALYSSQDPSRVDPQLALESKRLATAMLAPTGVLQSAIVAPVSTLGCTVGAILLGSTSELEAFDQFDLWLFERHAQSAATALTNARSIARERAARNQAERLNREIQERYDRLAKRLEMQDSLGQVVREDLSAAMLVTRLSELCGARVAICDQLLALRTAHPAADALTMLDLDLDHRAEIGVAAAEAERTGSAQHVDFARGRELVVAPVVGGSEVLGFLCAIFDRSVDEVDMGAVLTASQIAAIEFIEQRAREEGRVRADADVLDRLMQGRPSAGMSGPFLLAVGRIENPTHPEVDLDERLLRTLLTGVRREMTPESAPAAATIREDCAVFVWSAAAYQENVEQGLYRATERFALLDTRWRASFVISDDMATAETFSDTLAELTLIARLQQRAGRRRPVRRAWDLGAYRLIMRSAKESEVLSLCKATLGPVLVYDRDRGASLFETLVTYFAENASTKSAAAALSVHPHTVQYRLGRVEELCDLSLADPKDRLTLDLCVRIVHSAGLAGTSELLN